MKRRFRLARTIVGAALLLAMASLAHAQPEPSGEAVYSDTVHVAPPTGVRETDRASILAAFERVRPGGAVLFAPGTYLVGELITVETPRIAMQAHPQGTTLRACEPDEYDRMELAVAGATDEQQAWAAITRCGMFMLTGGEVAILGFTFEYTRLGLLLGCCHRAGEMRTSDGGYRIEDNTFQNVGNGIRAMLDSPMPSVIRRNRFINVFHALSAPQASHLHFIDNDVTVSEPHRVPAMGYPSFAVAINALVEGRICEHNLVSGNRIEGHPIAIRIGTGSGNTCRYNLVRDNVITASRVPLPSPRIYDDEPLITNEADPTFFGVPLQLVNGSSEAGQGVLEGNVIEGNRVIAAQGLAILIGHASGNRIVNNTIAGVARLNPFPGNILGPRPDWLEANGSGIWVSPGSEENEIRGNTFEDIAASAVVVEGDSNRVALDDPADAVRDLGQGNWVSGPGGSASPAAPPLNESAFLEANRIRTLESGRLIFHQLLHPVGEEMYTLTREGSGYLLRADLSHNDRGRTTHRSVALRVGPELEPLGFRFTETADQGATETVVDVNGGMATLTDPSGTRDVPVADGFFTTSAFAPHAVQMMLVRYWLRAGRPDSIPILPNGHAQVQFLGRDTLEIADDARVLDRYHVRGVRWGGQTVWLDADDQLIAAISFDFNYQAVREGYEESLTFFSDRARRHVLARAEERNRSHPPAHSGTFALVGGTVIDGTGAAPLDDATVLVRDGRIAAVGPRASVAIPANVAVVDVAGRTVLPGLWDMHAHLAGIPAFGPIYLAAGVTTVRDVGNETEWGLALRDAFRSGRIAGPHVLLAAEIDGKVPESVGAIQADTPEEARRLVRHFHGLGFDQIKLYSSLSPDLVPVITGEAHRLGMTVTGHVPAGMTAVDAVRAGMDQLNHFGALREPMLPDSILASGDFSRIMATFLALDSGSAEVRRLIDVLLQHGTVLDPTLAAAELRSRPASVPLRDIHPGAAGMPPEVAATIEAWFPGIAGDGAGDLGPIFRKSVELVGELHRAGVPIVAGTDVVVPGHGLHRELELYVQGGMSPLEAIQAASIVPARAMGLEQEAGTVEVGKRADLMIIDGDPLRSIREIRNVHAVVADGRLYDAAALWRSTGFEPVPAHPADTTAAQEASDGMDADGRSQDSGASHPVYGAERFFDTEIVFPALWDRGVFSHDERRVQVGSDRTGTFNAFAIPVEGGEPEQLTNSVDGSVVPISWFPHDDRFLYEGDEGGNERSVLRVRERDGSSIELSPRRMSGRSSSAGARTAPRSGWPPTSAPAPSWTCTDTLRTTTTGR